MINRGGRLQSDRQWRTEAIQAALAPEVVHAEGPKGPSPKAIACAVFSLFGFMFLVSKLS